jgi:autotransporter-associated beta strand protein
MKPTRALHFLATSIAALTIAHTASGIDYDTTTTLDSAVTSSTGVRVGVTNPNVTLSVDNGGLLDITGGSIDFGSTNGALVVNGSGTLGFVNASGRNLNLNAGSGNSITVQGGGTFTVTGDKGTFYLGSSPALAPNTLTVTGSGSTFTNGNSTQGLNIWFSGSNARIIVSDGGVFTSPARAILVGGRWGANSNNSLSITGAGSTVTTNSSISLNSSQGDNSANMTLTISNGGVANSASGNVSSSTNSNNNTATITGSGSLWNLGGGNLPVGSVAGTSNNTLNVFDGGSLNNVGSVLMNGTNNQFNLGSGSATLLSTAAVNTVTLGSTGALLNLNNGFLIARAGGDLASGTGRIDLKGPAYVSNATGLSNTISVVIEDTTLSGAAFIKEGAGTLTLKANNTYMGATTVHGGTLVADNTAHVYVIRPESALVLGRGGKFKFLGTWENLTPLVMDGLTLNPGSNGIEVSSVDNGVVTLDLRGAAGTLGITRSAGNAGGTVDFKAATGTLGTTELVQTVQANVDAGILGAWATVNDGAGLACNDGTDSIVAYAGYSDIMAGTSLSGSQTTHYRIIGGGGGPISLGATIHTLTQNSTTAASVNNNSQTLRVGGSGGILMTPGSAALTIGISTGDGALTAGDGNGLDGELVLGNFSGDLLTINAAVTDNSSGVVTLTKSGGGDVILNGANTYTGATFVGAGTLSFGADGAIGTGALVVSGGTLAMGSFSNQSSAVTLTAGAITGSGTLASTSGFVLDGSAGTSCEAILADGVMESVPVSVGLVKSGPGTAPLAATHSYSGATVINAGTLAYGLADVIGAGAVTVNGGILAMGAFSDEVGAVTLTAGAITGSGTLTSTSGFTLNGSGTTYCTAILAGSGVGLVKSGTGTATLTAANTYTGNTDVELGTLVLSKACLDDNSTVSISSGAVMNLAYAGSDTVKQLFIGGSQALAGTYGSLTSSATFKSATFTGNGILNVTESPVIQPNLTLVATPDTFKETDGARASIGTVSIPDALGYDLEVALSTTDPLTANVPTSVTIYTGSTNAEFWIEAVNNPLVQGTRTATLTASGSGYNNATILVTVTKGGYESWKTANAGGEAADLDYDKDGVSNGVEFFMGETGTTFTPNPSVVDGKVSWPYDPNTAGTGMTYKVTTSTNLVSWDPVDPQPVPAAGKLEYTLPTGNPARFVRLEVTTP